MFAGLLTQRLGVNFFFTVSPQVIHVFSAAAVLLTTMKYNYYETLRAIE